MAHREPKYVPEPCANKQRTIAPEYKVRYKQLRSVITKLFPTFKCLTQFPNDNNYVISPGNIRNPSGDMRNY